MRSMHTHGNSRTGKSSGALYPDSLQGSILSVVVLVFSLIICAFPAAAAQDAATLNGEGAQLLRAGDPSGALAAFDRAIAADPGYLPARVNRGVALLSLGRADEALFTFEVALDLDPRNTPAWIYRGDALTALGKPNEAGESYSRAKDLEPGNPLLQERIGSIGTGDLLSDIAGIPLVFLIAGITIAAGLCGAAVILHRRRKREEFTAEKGEDMTDSIRKWALPSQFRGSGSPSGKPLKKIFSDATGAPAPPRVMPPGDNNLICRVKSVFQSLSSGYSMSLLSSPGNERATDGGTGPLEMAGSEVFSSVEGNTMHAGPENREQITGGFDRLFTGSEIDPSGFRGLSHYAMGDYGEALEEFSAEGRADQKYSGIQALRASALLRMGRSREALESCEAAISEGNGRFEILKIQGSILEQMETWDESLRACDEALSQNPHSVEVWSMRARVLHALARDHEALQSCERALGMDPSSMVLLWEKAVILADLGRVDDALATLDQGISADHRETSLLLEKGRILHRSGRPREALEVIDAALALSPDDDKAWRELAQVFHTMEDPLEEAAAWERASALNSGELGYLISWGDALRNGGEFLASAKVFMRVIRQSPRDLTLWHRLGGSLYSAGKYNDSTRAFRFIIKESPQDGKAWKYLGCSLLRAGMPGEAIPAFQRADSLLPGDPGIAEGLRRATAAVPGGEEGKDTPVSRNSQMSGAKGGNGDGGKSRPLVRRDFGVVPPGSNKEIRPEAEIPGVASGPETRAGRDMAGKEKEDGLD